MAVNCLLFIYAGITRPVSRCVVYRIEASYGVPIARASQKDAQFYAVDNIDVIASPKDVFFKAAITSSGKLPPTSLTHINFHAKKTDSLYES